MKQTHKKALLVAALLSAALAGTMLALSPSWERRREKQEQEAMIVRLAGEEAQGTEASPRTEPETEPPAETGSFGGIPGRETGRACRRSLPTSGRSTGRRRLRSGWKRAGSSAF